ncbi:MAG: hypothetical protein ACRDN9_01800 [Streptosporangiaceae bacterium]
MSSVDWRNSADRHRAYIRRREERGCYQGETSLRLRFGEVASDWFDWVLVDVDTLAVAAARLGLRVDEVLRWGPKYAARLVPARSLG